MSSMEEDANISGPLVLKGAANKEPAISKEMPFFHEIKSKTMKWLLPTYDIFLSVLHVTLTIVFATLGDALVILVITWVFGKPENQPLIAQKFFEGLKILSIVGASATYAIYLTYSLVQDVQHVREMIREDNKDKEKEK